MDAALEYQADTLLKKIKHYLITLHGLTYEEANTRHFYQAFCHALREEIMVNWIAGYRSQQEAGVRRVNYISMEYLPGRFLGNNLTNLHQSELVRCLLKKAKRDLHEVISCEVDPGLGNGGLGRLASCFLDSLATLQYPARGYGLRYQYGIFEQQLLDGVQQEKPDRWLFEENPWERRRDGLAYTVRFGGTLNPQWAPSGHSVHGIKDCEEVRAMAFDYPIVGYSQENSFNVVTMRLWTTKESPRNFQLQRFNAGHLDLAAENTTLTDVLYPNDNNEMGKRIRLKQEYLLVSASVQDILTEFMETHKDITLLPDKVRIQINDTHPALVISELIKVLTKDHQLSWEKAREYTQEITSYTNHTILREALEEWNQTRLQHLLPQQYQVIEHLNQDLCDAVRNTYPNNEEKVRSMSIIERGQVRMANLSIFGSHRINGVAALHSEIIKQSVFKDFYELYPERFTNVTNGVTQRRWLMHCNPEFTDFIDQRIGDGWKKDFEQIGQLAPFSEQEESQDEFLRIKRRNKENLFHGLLPQIPLRDLYGNECGKHPELSPDALLDVQIKRIHEYKRQLLNALHLIMIHHDLLESPDKRSVSRIVLFAGKAAPGYQMAKAIIRLIHCIAKRVNQDPATAGKLKVIILENYNVSRAEMIIPAADLSQQISTAGWEASGTGNMKLSMNGALTIGTEDGANVEMRQEIGDEWWPFRFGHTADQIVELRNSHSYDPMKIYLSDPKITRALDALRDGSYAQSESEHEELTHIYRSLIENQDGKNPDYFFVLADLMEYYETQLKVEELYSRKNTWAQFALRNVAGMGKFSTDVSIRNYAHNIWDLEPCPVRTDILEKVRAAYAEHDQCRILSP